MTCFVRLQPVQLDAWALGLFSRFFNDLSRPSSLGGKNSATVGAWDIICISWMGAVRVSLVLRHQTGLLGSESARLQPASTLMAYRQDCLSPYDLTAAE